MSMVVSLYKNSVGWRPRFFVLQAAEFPFVSSSCLVGFLEILQDMDPPYHALPVTLYPPGLCAPFSGQQHLFPLPTNSRLLVVLFQPLTCLLPRQPRIMESKTRFAHSVILFQLVLQNKSFFKKTRELRLPQLSKKIKVILNSYVTIKVK